MDQGECAGTWAPAEERSEVRAVIVAVVVLFYPKLLLLERLLASLVGQVDCAVAVDNTPGSSTVLPRFFERFPFGVSHVRLGENGGIAEAQNVGIREGVRRGCTHVLLLDQDSVLAPGMVSKLLFAESGLLKAGEKVAAVGPRYLDEKTGTPSCAISRGWLVVHKFRLDPSLDEPVETDNLIASGSLIRSTVLEFIGLMRSDLFIDFVDTEWGLRARDRGYKSYCVPSAVMTHSTGDAATTVFGKEVYVHSDLRGYYKLRNAVYLLRLPSMGLRWRGYTIRWIPYFFLQRLWVSKGKVRSARFLLSAVWDGLHGELGPAPHCLAAPRVSGDEPALSAGDGR